MKKRCPLTALALLLAVPLLPAETNAERQARVRDTERAFAKTMADRDHAAFVSFVSAEAIFWGRDRILRGRKEIAEGWKPLYEGPQAPFSWEPENVEVLDSGTIALSSGPVHDPKGNRVGTFNSVWRRGADGKWKVILDKGCPPCDCPPAGDPAGSPGGGR
jgi:ketosteroid isomerase-like protein